MAPFVFVQLTVVLPASSLLFLLSLFFNCGAGVVAFDAFGFNLSVRGCGGVCERRSALPPSVVYRWLARLSATGREDSRLGAKAFQNLSFKNSAVCVE